LPIESISIYGSNGEWSEQCNLLSFWNLIH
jgi:hypothetical protein